MESNNNSTSHQKPHAVLNVPSDGHHLQHTQDCSRAGQTHGDSTPISIQSPPSQPPKGAGVPTTVDDSNDPKLNTTESNNNQTSQTGAGVLTTINQSNNPGSNTAVSDNNQTYQTGSVWIASAHIITAIIGSGVLSLPWAMAQLGWLLGPIVILLFFFLPYYTCTHQFTQTNNVNVVQNNLGETQTKVLGWIQCLNMCGVAMGYTIAANESMTAILNPKCDKSYMVMFGAAQLILSHIPNIDEIAWLSMVAAATSFTYSIVGIALGIAKVAHNRKLEGSLIGVCKANKKIWLILEAIGEIVFAFMILPHTHTHTQGTVESPSSETTMRRAAPISVSVTTLLYMLYGCIGYAAFGDLSPKNLLTTKPECGFNHPVWVLDIANAAIVVHLIIAYQAYGQPTFRFIQQRFEKSRLVWTVFVITTTTLSIHFPYEEIPGLIVALGFWPSTVYYPVKMYIAEKTPKRSTKWWALQILSVVCLTISIAAAAGTAVGLAHTVRDPKGIKSCRPCGPV